MVILAGIIGVFIGGFIGIVFMCLVSINKDCYIKYNNGWIFCIEQLPPIYEDTNTSEVVLIQGYDKECNYYWQSMGWYSEESKQWFFAECKNTDKPIDWIDVVAWQPLPENCKIK